MPHPSSTGGEPAGAGLLVQTAQLRERDRERDDPVVVTGCDGRGAFDNGRGDGVVVCGLPASLDPYRRVPMTGEDGGLGPQRGVPGSP